MSEIFTSTFSNASVTVPSGYVFYAGQWQQGNIGWDNYTTWVVPNGGQTQILPTPLVDKASLDAETIRLLSERIRQLEEKLNIETLWEQEQEEKKVSRKFRAIEE